MTDVIVLGAGPAGSKCAEVCARAGLDVLVLEKRNTNWEKPCGGGVSARVIREFNIPSRIFERHPMTLLLGDEETLVTVDDRPQGATVMRSKFDSYLANRISQVGGKLLENTPVTGVSVKDGRIASVSCRSPKGPLKLQADIIIDATGMTSFLARRLGFYHPNLDLEIVCRQYHLIMPDDQIDDLIGNRVEIYFSEQIIPGMGYAWIFPKRGVVSVGLGTTRRVMRAQRVNLSAQLEWFRTKHPVASKKLSSATRILKRQAYLMGTTGITSQIYGDNWLITGEAAGFVSYVTGEGIYYGMVTGREAGKAAIRAIEDEKINKDTLRTYKDVTNQLIGTDMKWGPWLQKIFLATPWMRRKALKAAKEDKFFAYLMADLIGGNIDYRDFVIKLGTRPDKLLKALLQH